MPAGRLAIPGEHGNQRHQRQPGHESGNRQRAESDQQRSGDFKTIECVHDGYLPVLERGINRAIGSLKWKMMTWLASQTVHGCCIPLPSRYDRKGKCCGSGFDSVTE